MGEKNSNPIVSMIKTEWKHLGHNKGRFIFYAMFFVIAGIISLMSPWVIGKIFNSIQSGQITTQEQLIKLFYLISLLFVIRFFFWFFHGVGRVMEGLTAFDTHRNYTNSKVRKTLELPVKWHKDHHTGDTIDRINKARNALFSYAKFDVFQLIYVVVEILGSLAIMFFINIEIGIFALIFCSVILFFAMKIDGKIKEVEKRINKYSHKLSSSIFDFFSNIMTIITLRVKKTVKDKLGERVEAPRKDYEKIKYLVEAKWAVASLLISAMTVIILIYQANHDFKTKGIILIGTLYMLYSYLERVGNSFFRFAQFYGDMTIKAASVESVEPIDEEFEKIKDDVKAKKLPRDWKKIEVKDLDFTYSENGEVQHLDKINMQIKRGQKIALIGESGSGKSTVLSLIRGLYEPQDVEILCDSKKLKNGIHSIGESTTLIPQDPEIFNDTIRYNITMDIFQNPQELEKAIKMAQFEKVISRLKKGIETSVQEKGVSLSGGEKQRLALARGLLAAKNSDIILLDEPTSSVDSINEKKIHENIFKEFKTKTIISSIHRLHLLDKFDYIYMFDKGKIIRAGTFKEIKRSPEFLKIWRKYLGAMKK